MERFPEQAGEFLRAVLALLVSPALYAQIGIVAVALLVAWRFSIVITERVGLFRDEPAPGPLRDLRRAVHGLRALVLPVMAIMLLAVASPIGETIVGVTWLIRLAEGGAIILFVYRLAGRFIENPAAIFFLKWIGVPVALLYMAGWLDDTVGYLESLSVVIGNINVSVYAVVRTALFGVILFWLGRASSTTGQRLIRTQAGFDAGTREVAAKLFEIAVYALIFLLLVNVMGIDLTALAVFGGALGVGLGFGLQQIASNFISGIIILLDRTIAVGDYIELADGRAGKLRELTMRSARLETFDGKDIMVPNETFITTAFVNWTHNNRKQRYPLHFQVAYDTDLEALFRIVRETVASHPKVLSGDRVPHAERPDAEIESFGESGINILVEFWMEDIDDGENRVGADLLLMIWTALKENGIQIPFPQREVKVSGEVRTS
jgi:small-conductance mechanosensitive channel